MTSKSPTNHDHLGRGGKPIEPDWAKGLRNLYDSVVDEPLPDSFKDLLSRLDSANP